MKMVFRIQRSSKKTFAVIFWWFGREMSFWQKKFLKFGWKYLFSPIFEIPNRWVALISHPPSKIYSYNFHIYNSHPLFMNILFLYGSEMRGGAYICNRPEVHILAGSCRYSTDYQPEDQFCPKFLSSFFSSPKSKNWAF